MLKLTLEKGRGLDRQLEAMGKHFSRIVEDAQRKGWARVSVYPSIDYLIAGAAVYGALVVAGVKPAFRVSIEPPPQVGVPTVLLGYSVLPYGASDIDAPLIAFAPHMEAPPPPNSVYVEGDASVPSMIGLLILWIGGIYLRREILNLLLSGIYYGGKVDKAGRLFGLDQVFAERASSIELMGGIEVLTTLKSYLPNVYPTCKSISITLNPYYPGLTGRPDECVSLLSAAGLERLALQSMSKMESEDLKRVIKTVIGHIQQALGTDDIDVTDYVGGILVTSDGSDPGDFRMLADMNLFMAEWDGSPEPLLGLALDFPEEFPVQRALLESYASKLMEVAESARPKRIKGPSWLRVYLVEEAEDIPPTFLWGAMKTLGKVQEESLIAYEEDGDYIVSALQVEQALGEGELKKLKNIKVLEGDGLYLKLVRNEA